MKKYGIWLSCDVASAFDSVLHSKLADILLTRASGATATEAARLLQVCSEAKLSLPMARPRVCD